jgi:hypothetical protein
LTTLCNWRTSVLDFLHRLSFYLTSILMYMFMATQALAYLFIFSVWNICILRRTRSTERRAFVNGESMDMSQRCGFSGRIPTSWRYRRSKTWNIFAYSTYFLFSSLNSTMVLCIHALNVMCSCASQHFTTKKHFLNFYSDRSPYSCTLAAE